MIPVFIVPTGVGAEIGGHNGDATPAAKLIAACSDTLITHPNVVNASDINEMSDNMLYVEGSILDRFLEGQIQLEPVTSNKILVATNAPLQSNVVNSVSAARVTLGLDAEVVVLDTPLRMIGGVKNHRAVAECEGWQGLVSQVREYDFDALAITTLIEVDTPTKLHYFQNGGINPFGKVEAVASRLIADELNVPVAHSPLDTPKEELENKELLKAAGIADPRIAAELVSVSYLHCILKGLHRAPRIGTGLSYDDVSCLITPLGCVGRPHNACFKFGIPIIVVKENKTCFSDAAKRGSIFVDNYLEAAGLVLAMKYGIEPSSIRRPVPATLIHDEHRSVDNGVFG